MINSNYSGTKCPKCNVTSFEIVEDTPIKSEFKLFFLRCSSCKSIVTAFEYYNIHAQLKQIMKALKIR